MLHKKRALPHAISLQFFYLPQVAEINPPQPMDVTDADLLYDLKGVY
jgi:hypothetical protein